MFQIGSKVAQGNGKTAWTVVKSCDLVSTITNGRQTFTRRNTKLKAL